MWFCQTGFLDLYWDCILIRTIFEFSDWNWLVTTPGHTGAVAGAMRSLAWRLLSATAAGFEGSSTVCRVSSGEEGFEAHPSFTIAATDSSYITDGFTACLMTFCASHTDGYLYLATSYQRSVDLPSMVLWVPIPYGWVLSVQGRSVDLSGLMWVFMVTCVKFKDWRGKWQWTFVMVLLCCADRA